MTLPSGSDAQAADDIVQETWVAALRWSPDPDRRELVLPR
jgi:DNA-directed RNA polymerase specialized sigma24 family protein